MSILINNELIWLSIPKCASMSIELSLILSKLDIKRFGKNLSPDYLKIIIEDNYFKIPHHTHITMNQLYAEWGKKETICITRNWFSKWISALNYIWDKFEIEEPNIKLVCKWEELDNKTLYNIIDKNFINALHSFNLIENSLGENTSENLKKCVANFLYDKNDIDKMIKFNFSGLIPILISEKYWKSNQKCTYEFDITEIDKFVNFIENRFGEKLIIKKENASSKKPNKLIIDDELKYFVWKNFESIYEKRNELI